MMYSVILDKLALLEHFISNFISRKSYLNQSPENFFLLNIILKIFTRLKIMFILYFSGSKTTFSALKAKIQFVIFTAESHLFPSTLYTKWALSPIPKQKPNSKPTVSLGRARWVRFHL